MRARKPGSLRKSHGANGNGKTAQSYIAGIGASGALLAGAVVTFVFLVGAVSFQVWPTAAEHGAGDDALGVAELAGPGSGASGGTTLGQAVSLVAAQVPSNAGSADPKGGGGLQGRGDGDGGGATQPGSTDDGDGSGGSVDDGSGTADDPGDGGGSGQPSGGGSTHASNAPGGRPTNASNRPSVGSGTGTTTGTGSGTSSGGSSSDGSAGPGGGGSNHSDRG